MKNTLRVLVILLISASAMLNTSCAQRPKKAYHASAQSPAKVSEKKQSTKSDRKNAPLSASRNNMQKVRKNASATKTYVNETTAGIMPVVAPSPAWYANADGQGDGEIPSMPAVKTVTPPAKQEQPVERGKVTKSKDAKETNNASAHPGLPQDSGDNEELAKAPLPIPPLAAASPASTQVAPPAENTPAPASTPAPAATPAASIAAAVEPTPLPGNVDNTDLEISVDEVALIEQALIRRMERERGDMTGLGSGMIFSSAATSTESPTPPPTPPPASTPKKEEGSKVQTPPSTEKTGAPKASAPSNSRSTRPPQGEPKVYEKPGWVQRATEWLFPTLLYLISAKDKVEAIGMGIAKWLLYVLGVLSAIAIIWILSVTVARRPKTSRVNQSLIRGTLPIVEVISISTPREAKTPILVPTLKTVFLQPILFLVASAAGLRTWLVTKKIPTTFSHAEEEMQPATEAEQADATPEPVEPIAALAESDASTPPAEPPVGEAEEELYVPTELVPPPMANVEVPAANADAPTEPEVEAAPTIKDEPAWKKRLVVDDDSHVPKVTGWKKRTWKKLWIAEPLFEVAPKKTRSADASETGKGEKKDGQYVKFVRPPDNIPVVRPEPTLQAYLDEWLYTPEREPASLSSAATLFAEDERLADYKVTNGKTHLVMTREDIIEVMMKAEDYLNTILMVRRNDENGAALMIARTNLRVIAEQDFEHMEGFQVWMMERINQDTEKHVARTFFPQVEELKAKLLRVLTKDQPSAQSDESQDAASA